MWLKGVNTPVVLSGNRDERTKRAYALSLFIATVKILDFQMNALSVPVRIANTLQLLKFWISR